MNILSLFDGMSCAQIALERAGIHVTNYYASEVDKYAIKVACANHPNTLQVGDIAKLRASKLPTIDLLVGGSPCQGFSFAGRQLNFEDERSKLFFEYVRLLNECKPKYFLLENVKMKKEYQDVISKQLGVEPIEINSALVSAQNRKRLYWTNIPNVKQPEDKGLLLKDIIEDGFADRDKSFCLDASYYKGGNLKSYFEKNRRQLVFNDCLNLSHTDKALAYMNKPFGKNNESRWKLGYIHRLDKDKSSCINAIIHKGIPNNVLIDKVPQDNERPKVFRKLSCVECERLQTVPDNYTNHVSNTQRYKMLGNGFTVDVIAHILEGITRTV